MQLLTDSSYIFNVPPQPLKLRAASFHTAAAHLAQAANLQRGHLVGQVSPAPDLPRRGLGHWDDAKRSAFTPCPKAQLWDALRRSLLLWPAQAPQESVLTGQ